MEIQINLLGVELLVICNYYPEEEETNSGSDIEIFMVYQSHDKLRIDIMDLLEHHEAKIKDLVIEIIEE